MKNLIRKVLTEEVSTNRDLLNLYNMFVNGGIVDPEHISEYGEYFEIYNVNGYDGTYFLDNSISVSINAEDEEIILHYEFYEEDDVEALDVSEVLEGEIYSIVNPDYDENGWWVLDNL